MQVKLFHIAPWLSRLRLWERIIPFRSQNHRNDISQQTPNNTTSAVRVSRAFFLEDSPARLYNAEHPADSHGSIAAATAARYPRQSPANRYTAKVRDRR